VQLSDQLEEEALADVLGRVTAASDAKAVRADLDMVLEAAADATLGQANHIIGWLASRLADEAAPTKIKTLSTIKILHGKAEPLFKACLAGLGVPNTGCELLLANLSVATACQMTPHKVHGDKPQRLVQKNARECLLLLQEPLDRGVEKILKKLVKSALKGEPVLGEPQEAGVDAVALEFAALEEQQVRDKEEKLVSMRAEDQRRRDKQAEDQMEQVTQDEARYLYVTTLAPKTYARAIVPSLLTGTVREVCTAHGPCRRMVISLCAGHAGKMYQRT
jgi:hypothetical protein